MTVLAKRYPLPRGIQRLIFGVWLLGELALQSVKDAVAGRPPPEPFDLNSKDVFGEPPGLPSWGPGRWTRGGEA